MGSTSLPAQSWRIPNTGDLEFVTSCFNKSPQELIALGDPALLWIAYLYPTDKEREGKLNQLYGSLIEFQRLAEAAEFLPDANETLRLTVAIALSYAATISRIFGSRYVTVKCMLAKFP